MDLYSTLSLWLTNIRTVADIDDFSRRVIELNGMEKLSDDEANRLLEKAECRREALKKARSEGFAPPVSYFPEKQTTGVSRSLAASGSRDKDRWSRKRRLGDMACLAPQFRDLFTEGERSALYVIMCDWKQHGRCERSVKEIGDKAGVGQTTVRNALRKARRPDVNLLAVQERRQYRAKNLTNVITVVHAVQQEWLSRFRPKLGFHYHQIAFKKAQPTGTFGKRNKSGRPSYNQKNGPTGGLQPFASREPSSG